MTMVVDTPEGIKSFRMLVIRNALRAYVKHGMRVNRGYTPARMVKAASEFTGKTYTARQTAIALADMEKL